MNIGKIKDQLNDIHLLLDEHYENEKSREKCENISVPETTSAHEKRFENFWRATKVKPISAVLDSRFLDTNRNHGTWADYNSWQTEHSESNSNKRLRGAGDHASSIRSDKSNYDQLVEQISRMENQIVDLEQQFKQNSIHDEILQTREKQIGVMMSELESNQARIDNMKLQRDRLEPTTDSLGCDRTAEKYGIWSQRSPLRETSYNVNQNREIEESVGEYLPDNVPSEDERLRRVERLLINVLNQQSRQQDEISDIISRLNQSEAVIVNHAENYGSQLSDYEEEVGDAEKQLFNKSMSLLNQTNAEPEYILKFLNLLKKIDTDKKRAKCLDNVQSMIHDNFYENADEESDLMKDVIYPSITDIEAVDMEYLNDTEKIDFPYNMKRT